MYIDLIVFGIITIIVILYYKRFQSFVLYLGCFDIFLRILDFIKNNINLKETAKIIDKYLPNNIINMIEKYTSGEIEIILTWIFVGLMTLFLYYVTKILIKKKKV